MREQLLSIINEKIQCKYIDDDKDTWIKLEDDIKYVHAWYEYWNVKYQTIYFSEAYRNYTDISLVLYSGGSAVGIWPLSVYDSDDFKKVICSIGLGVIPPVIYSEKISVEGQRKIYEKCFEALEAVCKFLKIEYIDFRTMILDDGQGVFQQKMQEKGATIKGIDSECYIDLNMSEEEILNTIRRTNKYSIKKAKDLWKYKIIDGATNSACEVEKYFEKFRDLHIDVAGRETRSVDTWKAQIDIVNNQKGFLVLLYDDSDEMIGASLYTGTATNVLYAVAAYKRELFNMPVSHLSQWIAICYMKEKNIKNYYIGRRPYKCDWNNPTEKEIAIGHFKEGFATRIYSTQYWRFNIG